ncbi:MAG: efflux RND transporter periplasmic adaptor subunit [Alphaproteobacteria bacterium]
MTRALRLALALALAGTTPILPGAPDAAATEAPPMAVTTIAATRGTVVETVLVDGSLVAREEVLVGPQVEGLRILELLAEEGDVVAAGQPLARLDRSGLDIQLAQNDAALARAAAAIAQARSQIAQAEASDQEATSALERSRSLARSGVASAEALDQRLAAARGAAARLAAAREGLLVAAAARRQVEARVGAIAAMAGEPLFRIVADGAIELEAEVPEVRLPRLAPGQAVRVELAGLPAVEGRIRLLPSEVDRATRLGRLRVALPAAAGLRVGRFARGTIETARREAISLPLSAVRFDEREASVQVVAAGCVATRRVVLGAIAGGRAEVASGLAEGESVVLRAGAFLRDGDAVREVRQPR